LRTASVLAALVAAGVVAVAAARYPGSTAIFLTFNGCFVALAISVLPRPRLYVYTVLAAFLLLGLWAKTLVHTIWEPKFLEPVGGFANSAGEWDQALAAMTAAGLGTLAVRGLHLAYYRRRGQPVRSDAGAPRWFTRHCRLVWVLTLVAVAAVNAANLRFAFYQIGVNAQSVLPLRLHVGLSWLVNIGFALWIAALLWWDYAGRPSSLGRNIGIAFAEAFASSVSAFSRILYLVHAAPYWLALWQERRRVRAPLVAVFVLLFVASVFAVFALRASYYPANADLGRNIKLEIPQLVVQRWVGLEGVLAVGSLPERNAALIVSAIAESPKAGADSLYQRTARSRYRVDDTGTFTFGSNAGPVAVLLFSGSLMIVAAGMALIVGVLLLTEAAAARWTGNPFLMAVAGAALANVVSQTTFFYLTAVFLLQLWVAIAFIAVLHRIRG
jgi:hypothetical protein